MSSSDPLGDLIKKLDEIRPLAANVATLRQSTVEEETVALNAILAKIRPLLNVASHPIKTNYYCSGQQFSKEHVEHDHSGLILVNHFDQECTDRDTRGDYLGWQLIILADGTLRTLERAGDWSRWQGESSGWHITEDAVIEPTEAIKRWGLKTIIDGLADELKEASERLQGRKKSYEERLATIARIKEVIGLSRSPTFDETFDSLIRVASEAQKSLYRVGQIRGRNDLQSEKELRFFVLATSKLILEKLPCLQLEEDEIESVDSKYGYTLNKFMEEADPDAL